MNSDLEFIINNLLFLEYMEEDEFRNYAIQEEVDNIFESNGYEFVGSGMCSFVWRKPGSDYVIKSHYAEMNLHSNPTKELWEKIQRFGAEEVDSDYKGSLEEFDWYIPKFVKDFLFYEYISEKGFFAIQKFIDASEEAQEKAFILLGENGHAALKKNLGMDGNRPVIIDYW